MKETPPLPDLSRAAVDQWIVENEPDRSRSFGEEGPVEKSAAVNMALERLGAALDTALASNPGLLAGRLGGDPIRSEMRAIMAQIGLTRLLRIISWTLSGDLPKGMETMGALLARNATGEGQYLQAVLIEANRPSLLASIYSPERLQQLRAACLDLDLKKEAA